MNSPTERPLSAQTEGIPVALYRAGQVRELDRIAIQEMGIPGFELMTRAGRAAFEALRRRWPEAERVVVLCGGGNNGGDGYIVASQARAAGLSVEVMTPSHLREPRGDALTAQERWRGGGGVVKIFDRSVLDSPAIVVDGLLGTGLDKPVQGEYAAIIDAVNASGRPVLALDIPSGLSADTGMPLGSAVRAACTITFVGMKRGLLTADGLDYCGELEFSSLDIPPAVYQRVAPDATRIVEKERHDALPRRARNTHKGESGHVLVIGGEQGMGGAARMAAEAAARVGAGLVSVATRTLHASSLNASRPELMVHAVEKPDDLLPLLDRATVVAVGPGLGRGEWGQRLWDEVVTCAKPLVVDADGLNLLAGKPQRQERWILTPHPGEAARLLGCETREIQGDRFAAVRRLQQRYGGVVVLKGAGTLVCSGAEAVGVCTDGNPGMASGGMGDVLTGVIAGLWAQGLGAGQAARVGVHVHGRAGDLAAGEGERGLLAGDLLSRLRSLVNPA